MRGSPLRGALYAVGGLFALAALYFVLAGCPAAAWRIAIPGLVLILALGIEQWRYQRLRDRSPGPDWTETDERFVDPETGRLVTVYFRPSTGERRYVASSDAAAGPTRGSQR
jgi:hypothetical protein